MSPSRRWPPGTTARSLYPDSGRRRSSPFVAGQALDREDGSLRRAAARLLAQIHQVLASRPPQHASPAPGPDSPYARPLPQTPPELSDTELDRLEDGFARAPGTLSRGPLHGDYHPRNILCADGRITGVIDWDEANLGFLADELAWAAWEFCHTPGRDDLDFERAQAFIHVYRESGGPCPPRENLYLIPFIRRRLRHEVRRSLSAEERADPWDAADRDGNPSLCTVEGQESELRRDLNRRLPPSCICIPNIKPGEPRS